MGCSVCVSTCPVKALTMKPQESQAAEQEVFDYMVAKVAPKADVEDTNTVKGSQFKQPLLEFSGSCAGCAETAYARLVTQASTAWACTWARRPSAAAWPTRPAPCWRATPVPS